MKTYTYKEAAFILGYTYEHIVALVQSGKLGRKFKPCYEITQDDINNYKRPKRGRPDKLEQTTKGLTSLEQTTKGLTSMERAKQILRGKQ